MEKEPNNQDFVPKMAEDASVGDVLIEDKKQEMERYLEEMQKHLDDMLRTGFLSNFARDTSLRFVFRNKGGCSIDLETGRVNLPIKWFYKRKMNREQILFAVMHEIQHFEDLRSDPEGRKQGSEHIKKIGREIGAKMLEKWRGALDLSDPAQKKYFDSISKQKPLDKKNPSKGTMNKMEIIGYNIFHDFYNHLDDIWCNVSVGRKAPVFEVGSTGKGEIERLYKESLFKGLDYTKLSRHRQFMSAILRDNNVSDEKSVVSPDVAEALEREVSFMGKKYIVQDVIDNFIKPSNGRNTKASQRYFIIKDIIEPLFKELLFKDIEEWQPKKKEPKEKQKKQKKSEGEQNDEENEGGGSDDPFNEDGDEENEGDGEENIEGEEGEEGEDGEDGESGGYDGENPFEGEIKDAKNRSIGRITQDEIDKWKDKVDDDERKAEEKKKEDNKSPEQRAKENKEKSERDFAKRNAGGGFSEEEILKNMTEFHRIESIVSPYLEDLSCLWRYIVYGKSRIVDREMVGHFESGEEFDAQEAINKWAEIKKKYQTDERRPRIFLKREDKETAVNMPEKIRVRIVGDMSGSMDNSKREILKQVFVLLTSSLNEFNSHLNLTRSKTKTNLIVETEGYVFGSMFKKIKSFEDDANLEMVTVCSNLENTLGNTNDSGPLSAIEGSISEEEQELIKSGKIMDIVFEITDGGSTSEDETKSLVLKLSGMGIVPRAFQIGIPLEDVENVDRKKFDRVWNSDGNEFGKPVGTDIANLIPAVVKVLVGYLEGVQI